MTLARTRAAVLAGARESLLRHGTRRTTMADIAQASGVAKATLYNHFRAKADVWVALAESELTAVAEDLVEAARREGPVAALAACALRLGTDEVVRRVAATEPATWAALVLPGAEPSPVWTVAREALADLWSSSGRDADPAGPEVDLVLRWLVSQLVWPSPPELLAPEAGQLLATTAPDVVLLPAVSPALG